MNRHSGSIHHNSSCATDKLSVMPRQRAWEAAVEVLSQLPDDVPEGVDLEAYYTAVAQSYHHLYETTQDESAKEKVIEACEAVLHLNKRAREISKLLSSYQGKKPWWRR